MWPLFTPREGRYTLNSNIFTNELNFFCLLSPIVRTFQVYPDYFLYYFYAFRFLGKVQIHLISIVFFCSKPALYRVKMNSKWLVLGWKLLKMNLQSHYVKMYGNIILMLS